MKITILCFLAIAGTTLFLGEIAEAVPVPPCPQIGFADGCNQVITLNSGGTAGIALGTPIPYDGIEDQLVGVINNSGQTVGSITLSGFNIFGFDLDGAGSSNCDLGGPSPFGCPFNFGPTGYEGPNISFSVLNNSSGTVNFLGGLRSGGTTWFSLEEPPTAGSFSVTGVTPGNPVPEPSSLLLLGAGVGVLAAIRARTKISV